MLRPVKYQINNFPQSQEQQFKGVLNTHVKGNMPYYNKKHLNIITSSCKISTSQTQSVDIRTVTSSMQKIIYIFPI